MPDTIRSQSDMVTNLFQDGQASGSITANDVRDLVVSSMGTYVDTKSTNFTSADTTDAGVTHEFTAASAVSWTIPPNASVAYAIGTVIQACQYGTGQITIVPGSGVTIDTPSSLRSRAQYSTIGVRKRATNEWVAFGDLAPAAVFTPIDSSFALVFDEEFNGSSINTTRWNVLEGNTLNNVVVHASNVTVSNSCANFTLTGPYTSMTGGFITTNGSTDNFAFNATNGAIYFEGRCKMPLNAKGAWPAFWSNFAGNFPEFDLFEWVGAQPSVAWQTYHKVGDNSAPPAGTSGWGFGAITDVGIDLGVTFHIYSMLWTATDITFYVDGIKYLSLHNGDFVTGDSEGGRWGSTAVQVVLPDSTQSQNVIAQIGANGLGQPNADATTTFPAIMKIDYIHIYKQGGTAVAPQANYGGPGSTAGPTS